MHLPRAERWAARDTLSFEHSYVLQVHIHIGLMLAVKSFCFTVGSGKCKPLKAGKCILTSQKVKWSHQQRSSMGYVD